MKVTELQDLINAKAIIITALLNTNINYEKAITIEKLLNISTTTNNINSLYKILDIVEDILKQIEETKCKISITKIYNNTFKLISDIDIELNNLLKNYKKGQ